MRSLRGLHTADVHCDIEKLEQILERERYDYHVSHGDWGDNYHDTVEQNARAFEYLEEQIRRGMIWKLGNHDIPYFFNSNVFWCPGFSTQKQKAIREIITPSHLEAASLLGFHQGFLCSHAGLHEGFGHPTFGFSPDWIQELNRQGMDSLKSGIQHPLLWRGADRGGRYPIGGCTWMDWDCFAPIDGLNQLVGHTNFRQPRKKSTATSTNWNIDTGLRYYAIIEDGVISIKSVADLEPRKTISIPPPAPKNWIGCSPISLTSKEQ